MAYREVTMVEVKEVLRQWLAGEPKKRVAKRLSLAPRTVRRYCELAEQHGMRVQDGPSSLTDERLTLVLAELTTMPGRPHGAAWALCHVHRDFIARHMESRVRLSKVRKLLLRQGIEVPYPTLHRFAVEELGFGRTRATVPVEDGEPGSELQVDTGWMQFCVPDERGRPRRMRVWIFTPSLSRYRFVWPCFEESTHTAIAACEAAWAFYGGVFKVLIPDGTKAIVEKSDPLSPKITDAFLEYAQARGFVVDPARARRPTDKARVERSVRIVRDDCYGGEVIETREQATERARYWCASEYGQRRHSRTLRRPAEHFETVEAPALLLMPIEPYDVPHWRDPKVARDHYAQVLGALYSLPTKYIGQTLRARADSRTVRFYHHRVLIKTHPRKPKGGRSTDTSDFPDHVGHIARRDLDWIAAQARKHGPSVGAMAQELLDCPLPWTRIRRVYALSGLAKKYGSERVEQACAIALAAGMHDIKRLTRMLELGITQAAQEPEQRELPLGRYLRPSSEWALARTDTPPQGQSTT
jgi:transposase